MTDTTLDIPSGLGKAGKLAAKIVLDIASRFGLSDTGGCRAFYTPQEWADRGEEYGTDGVLVIVHDGGGIGYMCEHGKAAEMSYRPFEALTHALREHGMWMELCTSWYTAVYILDDSKTRRSPRRSSSDRIVEHVNQNTQERVQRVIQEIRSLTSGLAEVAEADALSDIADILGFAQDAVRYQAQAVTFRLARDIDRALDCESKADQVWGDIQTWHFHRYEDS